MWHETLSMLRAHPLFGAGLAAFPTAIAPYHNAEYYEIFQYPHNTFLTVWSELGILGLLAFLVIAYVVVRSVWQERNSPHVLAAFAGLSTMVIHGLVDVPFFKNDLALLTALLLACIATQHKKNTAPQKTFVD